MFDLHRHDEFSTFDGFGKARELAELCVEYGYKSLSTTNHGNTNGLVKTYEACKEYGLKAILGVEGYFIPKYQEQHRGYHLILIAKNLQGYKNLNKIQYEGEKQKYYNPIWDFKILEKHHEGLICSTACVAGFLAQCIINNKQNQAIKFLEKMQSIFGEDFYVEIQPYKVSEKGLQEKVNIESIKLAKKLGIKCILTSDSHRGRKEDFDTYMKMHEIANHNFNDIEATYKERYMPKPNEMQKRFYKMHKNDFGKEKCKKLIKEMVKALDEIEEKCEANYLDELPLELPKLSEDSSKKLMHDIKQGLKERGKYNKEYLTRAKEEYEVIKERGFVDYFLMVADYVNYAKNNGIVVGAGRGSVCNSIVAYALKITEVDSILLNLDFRRFMRKDKVAIPDIDLDFETSRRQEVIEYLCKKYEGHAARICSYGLYKVDNLINDLAKVCGLPTDKTIDEVEIKENKSIIKDIKSLVKSYIDESGELKEKALLNNPEVQKINKKYDNIFVHFSKLYLKVRYIGTHAAGVAITGGNILDYTALRIDKSGSVYTNYDLNDIEGINVIKFDILGLQTMESIGDLRKQTGVVADYDEIIKDKNLLEDFRLGKCDGVFQFESNTAREILNKINCDCFEDVIAASSMNRPAPLKLGMPDSYAYNKMNVDEIKDSFYYKFAKDSYGAVIYQEQLMLLCVYVGGYDWSEADKFLKITKHGRDKALIALESLKEEGKDFRKKFVTNAIKNGMDKSEAQQLFENMLVYSFVKGHGTGYSLISMEEMFYKHYYPNEFWYAKLKYAGTDENYRKFCEKAVADGVIIFLPHVNYSYEKTRLRKVDGENCLQQGIADLKGVGEKAASYILEERKKNGIFTSYDNFYDRCKSRTVTSRVIDILQNQGALEFNKKAYIRKVTTYNSTLYQRGI